MMRYEATVIKTDEVIPLSATADIPAFGAAQRLADLTGPLTLERVTRTTRRRIGLGSHQTESYVFHPIGRVRSPQQTSCSACGSWLGAGHD